VRDGTASADAGSGVGVVRDHAGRGFGFDAAGAGFDRPDGAGAGGDARGVARLAAGFAVGAGRYHDDLGGESGDAL